MMGILMSNRLRLRPLEQSDASLLASWMNDHEITKYLLRYLPITVPEEEEWIANQARDRARNVVWGIEVSGVLIGTVALVKIDHRNGTCTLGISIGDKTRWGQGYGAEAIQMVIKYAFDSLNLRKIYLKVHATNKRARACYVKCGFRQEGCLKKDIYVQGKYVDTIIMSIFRP
jgi:RimJ/RimL family protein N-acetyltransferase